MTVLIAIYAAIVSTIALAWEIRNTIKRRPNLKVYPEWLGKPELIGAGSQKAVYVNLVNTGKEPLTVVAIGCQFNTSADDIYTATDDDLPLELTQGQIHKSYLGLFGSELSELTYIWARDASGKTYRSKTYPVPAFKPGSSKGAKLWLSL
jgi:hypothetical protein